MVMGKKKKEKKEKKRTGGDLKSFDSLSSFLMLSFA